MNKTIVAIIVTIFLIFFVCCCCALLVSAGAAAWMLTSPQGDVDLIEVFEPALTPQPLATRQPAVVPSETFGEITPETSLPEDSQYMAELALIESQVSELRGLSLKGEINRKSLSADELSQYVMEDFMVGSDEEDNRINGLILNLFGLLEKDYDLNSLFVDLYSEQIAGFYDDETKEMVVVAEEKFAGPQRLTYAHEFTHALQDEAFDLNRGLGLSDERCMRDSEYCAAVQALVEGDATLTETLWFSDYSSAQDKKQILDFYDSYESPIFDTTPRFLQADFTFAYDKGLIFVQALYEKGGMAAVDAAYAEPPASTEQILHPQRYPDDEPEIVRIVGLNRALGPGWTQLDDNTLGEWYTYLLLAQSYQSDWNLSEEDALTAAEGWGGDRYVVFEQDQGAGTVLVYRSQWDTLEDATEFWQSFGQYSRHRWGDPMRESADYFSWNSIDGVVVVAKNDDTVLWLIAPNQDLMGKIEDTFPQIIMD